MYINAKFPGTCSSCKAPINKGEEIRWERGQPPVHRYVTQCHEAKLRAASDRSTTPIPLPTLEVTSIVQFLTAAQNRGLKRPKLRVLDLDGKSELRLSLTTSGQHPGSLSIKRGFDWLGYIKPDGSMSGQIAQWTPMQAHLCAVAKDPAKAAKDYAAVMCACCFCGKALEDDGSVEVGYGPVCAKKWGLPHRPQGVRMLSTVPGTFSAVGR